jgi:1,2-diacylglycerol 3-beta-galactosyltransferase
MTVAVSRAYVPPASPVPAKRFLFLFSDTGGGHRASAQAVKNEFERLYGDAALVDMVDVFVEMQRWPFDRFPAWYPTAVSLNAVPWRISYRLTDAMPRVKTLSYLAWPYVAKPLCRLLRDHPADVVVSFHGIPNVALLLARRKLALRDPFAIVALDLVTVHAGWFAPGADAYLVPTQAAKMRALRCGVAPERITVVGMPTRRCFLEARALAREVARDHLGLSQDKPLVLIVGGGEGMGPLVPVVQAIAARRPDAYLVAIAGRNRALQAQLRALDLPVQVQVEGFVANIEVWMRAADVLVTKAGPNTISEAFIAGLPLVLYTALPGQESGNVDHVVENRAGVWAPQPKATAAAVMDLLANPERRAAIAAQSAALARPHATEQIVRHLWDLGQLAG